jgi:septum site-determining protein MinC
MIFCDRLEAELVAIAGTYLVAEELDPQMVGRRVRVRHDGDRLVVEPLGG